MKIIQLNGKEIHPYLEDLAKLRIEVFKEYPYLYQGSMDYETKYLQTYFDCPESRMIIVLDKNKIVGASTAIPLEFETKEFHVPFENQQIPIKTVFYLGESVLLPEYRGRKIYRQFFQLREKAATDYGCDKTAFMAVERQANDPRKPKEYQPLDSVWQHFGYKKHPELFIHFPWQEIGEAESTTKRLTFWLKKL